MGAAGLSLPLSAQAFVDAAVVVSDLALPQWYPAPGLFDDFQLGYRCDARTGQDLCGEAPGQWRPGWVAVAANYFRDPYFIDVAQADAGCPVWYAPAGAGRWTPSLAAVSIERFGALLRALEALGDDPAAMLALLDREVDVTGAPWIEIRASIVESMAAVDVASSAAAPSDAAPWTRGALVLQDAGPRRVEVAQCVRRLLGVTPARALALLKSPPLELCDGFEHQLEPELQGLRALGATVAFVAAGRDDTGPVASAPHPA